MKAASPQSKNRLTLLFLPLSMFLIVLGWTAGSHPAFAKREGKISRSGIAPAPLMTQTGIASYYGERYQGRRTASGESFDMNKLTAAHRSLPFGTAVRVTNLTNHRSVVVRINDRGPYVGDRIIDLSLEAARQLDMTTAGIVQVRMEAIDAREQPAPDITFQGSERRLAVLMPPAQADRYQTGSDVSLKQTLPASRP